MGAASLNPSAGPGRAEAYASWRAWFEERRERVNAAISEHVGRLKSAATPHTRLLAAVEYSLLQPGKRLRPVLVLESCRLCGGRESAALPAALAGGFIHTFSLIHAPPPAMDDDDLRRGQPTSHKVFGEALAILAGDWLLADAFELLASAGPGGSAAELVRTLAGGAESMVIGQAADIEGEGQAPHEERVEFIHQHKTARLMETCGRLGALCAGAEAERVARLGEFGLRLGLAFQIADDMLDQTGSTARLGKRAGKDDQAAKQTFPAVFGAEESLRRGRLEVDAALRALEPFAGEADALRGLARYVIDRDH